MAVVVLPTPPFWFAIKTIIGDGIVASTLPPRRNLGDPYWRIWRPGWGLDRQFFYILYLPMSSGSRLSGRFLETFGLPFGRRGESLGLVDDVLFPRRTLARSARAMASLGRASIATASPRTSRSRYARTWTTRRRGPGDPSNHVAGRRVIGLGEETSAPRWRWLRRRRPSSRTRVASLSRRHDDGRASSIWSIIRPLMAISKMRHSFDRGARLGDAARMMEPSASPGRGVVCGPRGHS